MIKKILTLCIILTIASAAQTYDIYDVNGKWYGKVNGQINKSVIEKYKQNVDGSVLVWKQSGKKKKNIDESNAPLRIIDLKQDSLKEKIWIELEKYERAKICIDEKVIAWETSINSKISNDSCLSIQASGFVGTETIFLYKDMSKYQIFVATGMKHLKFDNEKVALGFDTHPLPMIGRTVREEDPKRIVSLSAEYLVDKYPVTNCEIVNLMWDSIPKIAPAIFTETRKNISNRWTSRKRMSKKGENCITQDSAANTVFLLQAMEYANQRSRQEGLLPYYHFSNTSIGMDKILGKGKYSVPYLNFAYHQEESILVTVNEKSDGYRLPYYDEWMIFARGGDLTNDAPWGDSSANVEHALEYAWFGAKESGIDFQNDSKPVGLLKPNGYGLYDVFGLVEEFVLFELNNPFLKLTNKPSCNKGGNYWTVLSHKIGIVDIGPYWKWLDYGYASPNYAAGMSGFRLVRRLN